MFDSPPPNLPLDPAAPPAPSSIPPIKKEPEDMFAGLDQSVSSMPTPTSEILEESPRSARKIILLSLLIVVVVAGIGVASWYLFLRPPSDPVQNEPLAENPNAPMVVADAEPVVEVPPVVEQITPPQVPITTPPAGSNVPPPQSITPPAPVPTPPVEGTDADRDGLTDAEEALLGASVSIVDSDGDSFADGSEFQNGYDPARPSATLTESPAVRSATIGNLWTVWLPTSWTIADSGQGNEYLIQTETSASFSLQAAAQPFAGSFAAWLANIDPAADPASYRSFRTKQGYDAWQSSDRLTTYVAAPKGMVIIRYGLQNATSIDFRAIYEHMIQTIKSL